MAMTVERIIAAIAAFIASYMTAYFLRGFFRDRQLIRPFLAQDITSADKAKLLNDVSISWAGQKPIRLLPYVHLFQKKILNVTQDHRIYLDRSQYKKKLFYDLLIMLAIDLIFIGIVVLTFTV